MLNTQYYPSNLGAYMNNAAFAIDAPCVFVFWNNLYQDQLMIDFVTRLRNAGIEVKLIDAADSAIARLGAGRHRYSLQPDITLDAAMDLVQHAVCVVLPYDLDALGLVLALPDINRFLQKAAENNAHFVGHNELVVQFALDKTVDKSFDWVYPNQTKDLGSFLSIVAKRLQDFLH